MAATLKQSPLHDRHVALGAKFAEFGGWSMPLEYPTGVVKEHTTVREAGRHLRRQPPRQGDGVAARAPPTSSTRRSPTTSPRSSPARRSTRSASTRPAASSTTSSPTTTTTSTCCSSPTPPTPPRSYAACRPRRPRASRSSSHHDDYAVLAVQGTRSDEVLQKVGLPTGHDYMSFVEAELGDTGVGVVVCRTGYTGERGYELIVANDGGRAAVGRAAGGRRGVRDHRRAASAPATRCAPRWATPSTARTSASTSTRSRPGCRGRSAGRRTPSGAATRSWRSRRRARSVACAAWSPSAAASRVPAWASPSPTTSRWPTSPPARSRRR